MYQVIIYHWASNSRQIIAEVDDPVDARELVLDLDEQGYRAYVVKRR